MSAIRKSQFSAAGDPYGNRTRVSAVKGEKPFRSTARPLLSIKTTPLNLNGLRGEGDKNGAR